MATLMNAQLTWQRDGSKCYSLVAVSKIKTSEAQYILCKLDVLVTFYHINHERHGTGNCAKITSTYNRASWTWALTLPLLVPCKWFKLDADIVHST